MATTTVRMDDELLGALDEAAAAEGSDRATVIRRALALGLHELAIDRAVRAYQRGGISAWKAAADSGVTLWTLMDELEGRDAWFRTDEETLREQLEELT